MWTVAEESWNRQQHVPHTQHREVAQRIREHGSGPESTTFLTPAVHEMARKTLDFQKYDNALSLMHHTVQRRWKMILGAATTAKENSKQSALSVADAIAAAQDDASATTKHFQRSDLLVGRDGPERMPTSPVPSDLQQDRIDALHAELNQLLHNTQKLHGRAYKMLESNNSPTPASSRNNDSQLEIPVSIALQPLTSAIQNTNYAEQYSPRNAMEKQIHQCRGILRGGLR